MEATASNGGSSSRQLRYSTGSTIDWKESSRSRGCSFLDLDGVFVAIVVRNHLGVFRESKRELTHKIIG